MTGMMTLHKLTPGSSGWLYRLCTAQFQVIHINIDDSLNGAP